MSCESKDYWIEGNNLTEKEFLKETSIQSITINEKKYMLIPV